MNKPLCTYCGKPVRNKYGFSYGFPSVPRTFRCDRFWCNLYTYRMYNLRITLLGWIWRIGKAMCGYAEKKNERGAA